MDILTKIIKVDEDCPEKELLSEAALAIQSGKLVAFPTETVYGLGADAKDAKASERIYSAKGRPSDNPLIVHIADVDDLNDVAKGISEDVLKLARTFWPGPLTMVLNKSDIIPIQITGGLDTVAVRMPSHPIARELIRQSKRPIAAPSANISGRPSPTRISHVIEDMSGRIDVIIDGGDVQIGLESTIVDMTTSNPVILRKGFISQKDIENTIEKKIDISKAHSNEIVKPKAPGMKYRHYAPKGEIIIIKGSMESLTKEINERLIQYNKEGKKTAIICTDELMGNFPNQKIFNIGSRNKGEDIASNLYNVLHKMDTEKIDVAFSESFYGVFLGDAIMERLEKAASYRFWENENE